LAFLIWTLDDSLSVLYDIFDVLMQALQVEYVLTLQEDGGFRGEFYCADGALLLN
jgi:hypothetical protein